jgi:hypothetical protein
LVEPEAIASSAHHTLWHAMKLPVMHASLAVVAILLTTAMMESSPGADQPPPVRARAIQTSTTVTPPAVPTVERVSSHTPRTTLLFNDPVREPHAIADAIKANIDATAPGESIDVSAYLIDSPRVATALERADRRGVAVRVILAKSMDNRTATSEALAKALNAAPARSRLIWSETAARGRDGMLHEKTFRFSRVGEADWVTMTGSYNASDTADTASYATMWQVTERPDIYNAFAKIAAQQRALRTLAHPYREFEGDGWSAYFLPSGPMRPAEDPVVARLARIPAEPSSEIRIAMFSMWDDRGAMLAERLAQLSRGGARVTFVAGPTVSRGVLATVRAGGVHVRSGCFADGRYAHGKDMSASYVVRGKRQFWTWVGSDNWTTRGMESDQAVLGMSRTGYRDFGRAFSLLTARDDGVFGRDCVPRGGD